MSKQSNLTTEKSVAEQLAEDRQEISVAEFFEGNKQMLGFDSKSRSLITAIKEAVDNSLDATEEIGVLPDVRVEIEEAGQYYRVTVEDNGPGITKEQIPKVFGKLLYGSRFHSRAQSRGQQGIGISAAVLYSQITSGKPARIVSKTEDHEKAQLFKLIIDTDNNEAEISEEREFDWGDKKHGTKITLEMEANLRSRAQLWDYMKYTAVVNPHARIEFKDPKDHKVFERVTDQLPPKPEEIPPHPHGVELGTVQDMLKKTDSYSLSGFLQEEFTRVGQKTADEILNLFRDHQFGKEMAWTLDDEDEEDLLNAIQEEVSNKGAEATEAFATAILEGIRDQEPVAYTDIKKIVHESAEETGGTFSKTFGSTVRTAAIEAAWPVVYRNTEDELYEVVRGALSKRKSDELAEIVTEVLLDSFNASGDKQRVSPHELREIIQDASDTGESEDAGTLGDTAQEKLYDALNSRMTTVTDDLPNVREIQGERDKVANLVRGMHEANVMAPPTKCLSPINPDLIKTGMKKVFDADFYSAATRSAGVHSGEPFIVEAGIAYGGSLEAEGKAEVLRFANRVPLVYQRGACSTTDVIKNIGWRNYSLSQSGGHGIPQGPAVIMVHVASTSVPFTSESKDAIANIPEIEEEMERAIREAARDLKSYLKTQKDLKQRRKKQNVVAEILPIMAEKAASVCGKETADYKPSQARIMNSLMLRKTGSDSMEFENLSGSSKEFTIKLAFSEDKPTYPSDGLERVETEDGWELRWSEKLSADEEVSLSWNSEEQPEFTVENIPEEHYTVINNE